MNETVLDVAPVETVPTPSFRLRVIGSVFILNISDKLTKKMRRCHHRHQTMRLEVFSKNDFINCQIRKIGHQTTHTVGVEVKSVSQLFCELNLTLMISRCQ